MQKIKTPNVLICKSHSLLDNENIIKHQTTNIKMQQRSQKSIDCLSRNTKNPFATGQMTTIMCSSPTALKNKSLMFELLQQ